MPPKTRTSSGYLQFLDMQSGRWEFVHRRVIEKRLGPIPSGWHVHHINGDKLDNRFENLALVHPKVHARLHAMQGRCYRCGRDDHYVIACVAKTFFDGAPLVAR